jgi:hypothetical protein
VQQREFPPLKGKEGALNARNRTTKKIKNKMKNLKQEEEEEVVVLLFFKSLRELLVRKPTYLDQGRCDVTTSRM